MCQRGLFPSPGAVLGHLEGEAPSGIERGVLSAAGLRPGLGTRFDAGQGSQGWRTLWFFLPAREVISEDAFVRSVMRDRFDIRLVEPFQHGVIHIYPPALSALFRQHISAKIQLLLEKGAIERVRDHQHLCLSLFFRFHALARFLRNRGLPLFVYLDDSLLLASTKADLRVQLHLLLQTTQSSAS